MMLSHQRIALFLLHTPLRGRQCLQNLSLDHVFPIIHPFAPSGVKLGMRVTVARAVCYVLVYLSQHAVIDDVDILPYLIGSDEQNPPP